MINKKISKFMDITQTVLLTFAFGIELVKLMSEVVGDVFNDIKKEKTSEDSHDTNQQPARKFKVFVSNVEDLNPKQRSTQPKDSDLDMDHT
jgi:hypothetical protein